MQLEGTVVCEQCDLHVRETPLEPGGKATCGRCGNLLYTAPQRGLNRSLVFAITAAALFLISNFFPIVTIDAVGLTNSTTLLSAPVRLVHDGIPSIASLVFFTAFLMPGMQIIALIYLLAPLYWNRLPPGYKTVFRVSNFVKTWSMIEVFMIGLLVTISKLNSVAAVVPDIALISFFLLMWCILIAVVNFESRDFWQKVEQIKRAQEGSC
jgi:paraquat-inducible protein A